MGLFSYQTSYKNLTPEEADKKAILDIKAYLTKTQWDIMMSLVQDPNHTFRDVAICLDFAGVRGYPVEAFGRKYSLEKFKAWMQAPSAEGPIYVDKKGFRVPIKVVHSA